jgi:flagellar hook-associated protein 1 FlgK
VLDTLETYDAGGGQLLVRAATAGTPLTITGGSIQGTIDVRDGALATLQSSLDTLASTLITQVNTVHAAGYSLTGSTGANFFTGTGAATMGVNSALAADPSLVQAAGTAGTVGDNTIALALARLAEQPQAALNNQTFTGAYGGIVAALGQTLQGANNQLANHDAVQRMLLRQRDSISGVSIDEEMSDLVRFQTAYEASAKLIATIDEMLETVLSLKR